MTKTELRRVGDVTEQKGKLRINWANYSGSGMISFQVSSKGAVFAGTISTEDLKKLDKKLADTLEENKINELAVFALNFNKLAIWAVDDKLVQEALGSNVGKALSAFLKAFCLKNIKTVISNNSGLVFEESYSLKGSKPYQYFLLEFNKKKPFKKGALDAYFK